MAKKRRRTARARRSKSNPKRRLRKATTHPAPTSASKPRRRRARRAVARNPKRRGGLRLSARRRNPASSGARNRIDVKSLAIAGAIGVAGFLGVQAATYYATKDMIADGSKNRKIIGAVIAGLGVVVARKRPLMGAALVAGGILGGFSDYLTLKLMQFLPVKQAAAPRVGAVAYDNLAAVSYDNLAAVAYEGAPQIGAVAYDNLAGWETMGEPFPAAPWDSPNPF